MYSSNLSLTSALDWEEWLKQQSLLFYREGNSVHIVQRLGGAPWPVRTGTENLALTSVRTPDCLIRSELLY